MQRFAILSRPLGVIALCALVAAGAPAPVGAQQKGATLTVGLTSKTANEWVEFIADALGFYAANGIKVDYVFTGSAADGAQQLTAGSLDIAEVLDPSHRGDPGRGADHVLPRLGRKRPISSSARRASRRSAHSKARRSSSAAPTTSRACSWTRCWRRRTSSRRLHLHLCRGDDRALCGAAVGRRRRRDPVPAVLLPCGRSGVSGDRRRLELLPVLSVRRLRARTDWAKSHTDLVVRFIKSYFQGVRWLYNPANKTRAIQILSETTNTEPKTRPDLRPLHRQAAHLLGQRRPRRGARAGHRRSGEDRSDQAARPAGVAVLRRDLRQPGRRAAEDRRTLTTGPGPAAGYGL